MLWRSKHSMRTLTALALLLTLSTLHADEWWAWSNLEMWKQKPWSGALFLGNRLDTEDGAYVQIASPRVKYQLLPWLETGVGLSLLSIENTKTNDRHWQERPEFELNPKFDLSPSLRLEWRNRMEWRKNDGEDFTTHRTRHRLQLGWTLPQPVGPVTRIFASNEWLVDLQRHKLGENRLIPLGVTFKLSKNSDLDLSYMIFSQSGATLWRHESVILTYLRVRF